LSIIECIIKRALTQRCPVQDLYESVKSLEASKENVSVMEDVVTLMETHEVSLRKMRQKTSQAIRDYYLIKMMTQRHVDKNQKNPYKRR
jgi:hypothetical protein